MVPPLSTCVFGSAGQTVERRQKCAKKYVAELIIIQWVCPFLPLLEIFLGVSPGW